MKVVITAGGGGHFAPALSVIKKLPKKHDVLVIGRKYAFEGDKTIALEYRTAQALKIPFESITTARLQRSFTRHTIPSITKLPLGLYQAVQILKNYQPDVVLSFGGYVSVPVTFAARLLGIPVVIHEQTLGAGMANKLAAPFAKMVCLSFEESRKFFPEKNVVITGNPLREEILSAKVEDSPIDTSSTKTPLIYITGGSLGSHAINTLIRDSIEELVRSYTVFHQTGDAQEFKDYDRLQEKRMELPKMLRDRYLLTKFVNPASVGALMKSADLVVARAGMNTVSELIYLNTPALLIPLPYGQNREQLINAKFFEHCGLGMILEQEKATPEEFVRVIDMMMKEIKKFSIPPSRRKELIIEDASARMIDILLNVTKETKS